jgi:hypothetical protein
MVTTCSSTVKGRLLVDRVALWIIARKRRTELVKGVVRV